MALARLALKKVQQRVLCPSSASLLSQSSKQRWDSQLMTNDRHYTTSAADTPTKTDGKEVSVSDKGGKKSKLFSKKQRGKSLWRNNNVDSVPALWEFFPSGLGNALMQASENINRVIEKLGGTQLFGRFKEKKECYMVKYKMPGIDKDDLKITVADGVLTIRGEHREEEGEGTDDDEEYWSSTRYGYYDTRLALPDDAKVDEIKAEMKHGVLKITIPRTEKDEEGVKEVRVE